MSKHSVDNGHDYDRLLAQEELILEATEMICAYMASNNITRKELADLLGKSKGYVSQLLNGGRNLTLRTLADVSYALHKKIVLSFSEGEVAECSSERDIVIWRENASFWRKDRTIDHRRDRTVGRARLTGEESACLG